MRRVLPLALAVVLALPLAGLAATVLQGAPAMGALLTWNGLVPALLLSLLPGLTATALALGLVVLLLALRPLGFGLLQRVLAPLLALPHAAAALGFAFLIAPSGWIGRLLAPLTGWTAPPGLALPGDPFGLSLTLGLVLKETPFLLLIALASLTRSHHQRQLVAATLGYGRLSAFLLATWPALYPQLRLPVLAVLTYGMTTVDMALILGPTLPHPLSVEISLWMTEPGLTHQNMAAAGALVQLALAGAAILVWRVAEAIGARLLAAQAARGLGARFLDRAFHPLALLAALSLTALPVIGLMALALWSVSGLWPFPDPLPQTLSLSVWSRAAPDLWRASGTTLVLALTTTLAALLLAIATLQTRIGRRWEPLLYLPLILPQIAILPGLARALIWLPLPPFLAVALAHLAYVTPYVFLSLAGPWAAWDGRMAAVGATLGARPLRVLLTLRLPMLAPALAAAAAIGIAVSVGQYLPTLLLGGGRIATLTTEAVALASGANRRITGAYALMQAFWPALAFALAARIRRA